MEYIYNDPNPLNKNIGDCTVRAIAIAENITWDKAFMELCVYAFSMADMPSSNNVWGTYLIEHGYKYHVIPNSFSTRYSIVDFCCDNPIGTYILGTGTHVVCVKDGNYIDSWDSGNKVPLYYFSKEM